MSSPLTPNQERLWFLHRLDPGSVSYNLPWMLELRGRLDLDALRGALDRIIERHEPLRCRFVETDGEVRMVPRPAAPIRLDPTVLDDPGSLDEALRAEASIAFDLSHESAIRFRLFQLGADHHVLTWSAHHIVYDLSSYNVMLDEIEALYPTLTVGESPEQSPLPQLAATFGDYTRRIRREAAEGASEAALDHWRRALAGFEPLELPLDRPRPPRPWRPARMAIRGVEPELTSRLRELAAQHGRSTVFAPTLAAFYLLLQGLSGQDDLVLGVPIAGRDRDEVKPLVGFFVDVLALRVDLSDDPSFTDLVDRSQALFLEARRFPQPPFDRLAEELAQNRRSGENSFFPATFQLAREPRAPRLPGLDIRQRRLRADNAKFDIRMDVYDRGERLSLEIEYDTEILDPATIERWLDLYVDLLEQVVARPDAPISTLHLATATDRSVIDRANANASEFPGDLALIEQVWHHVLEHPDKLAIVDRERRWTWSELAVVTEQLADRLVAAGVLPGHKVGFCVDRSGALPLAMLGILAAGGAYVALDPNYPDDRLRFMIDDAGLDVLVVEQHLVGDLPAIDNLRLIEIDAVLDTDSSARRPPAATPPITGLDGDFPACLIYTSGSTGVPKASVLAQRGVTRLVVGTQYLTFRSDDVFTQTSSPSFDAATFEIWGALLHGGTLVVVDREDLLSPSAFGETLRREGATVVFLTTAYFQQLARQAPEVFTTPRAVFFGGERCEPDAVRRAAEACSSAGTRLFHAYGPSECTTYATVGEVHEVAIGATSVPIGGPVANTVARVVDGNLRQVPVGVAGELWLGGPGLAQAYHARPRRTAESFVPDPFGDVAGARLYRTGDRVRWLADGSFDFLGRVDHQVKLRGFRIEPGEIETALATLPGVDDALVMVREDVPGDRRLVAYVSRTQATEALDGASLRAHLGAEMPAYMVPSAVIVLDTFPLTPNGKVDRRALPAPERDLETAFRAPTSPTEKTLAELWIEALGIDRVGLDDDLFGLGGHSLIAVRLVSRLRDRLGVELPVRSIFENPRLGDLAAEIDELLDQGMATDAAMPVADLEATTRQARQRGALSFGQRRLWLLAQFDPTSTAYNMPLGLELHGTWDHRALERALSAVIERHEILRTHYLEAASSDADGEPRAVLRPASEVRLSAEALASTAELDHHLDREAATPFDLGREVLRLRLFVPADDTAFVPVLLVHVHHIAFDGWSLGVLRHELQQLHDAFASDPEAEAATLLPPLAMQYADHAARQRARLSGERLEALIEPWRQRLAGLEPLELPSDSTRSGATKPVAAVWRRGVEASITTAVRQLARRQGRTLFTTLLAGFAATLQVLTGRGDIALGVPNAGRDRSDLEGLLGFFVDLLVLRTEASDDPPFSQLVQRVQSALLDARAHGEVPFDVLVETLQPEREPGRNPFFQVAFQVVEKGLIDAESNATASGLRLADRPVDMAEAKFDLTVAVVDDGERLTFEAIYAAECFEAATIERWLALFEHLLGQVSTDPELRLSALRLLPEPELRLIARSNRQANQRNDDHFPGDIALIDQFRERVEASPQHIALRHRDRALSRGELWSRAERLAHGLVALGVRPGDFVGLCVDRGPQLVEGLLGILAAGAAYVPLDVAYPEDRLRFMIEDAGIAVLLSEAALIPRLPNVESLTVLDLDDLPPAPDSGPLPRVDGDFPAYVIFTSGSTGQPKGTITPHRAVSRVVVDTDWCDFDERDVISQIASPSFDASTLEIWSALLHGSTLAVVDREDLLAPEDLAATFERHGVTVSVITTSYFQQLAFQVPGAIARLRTVLFGGERCDPAAVRHAVSVTRDPATGGGTRLINCYGPTETTVMATIQPVDQVADDAGSVPIGLPITRTTARVVDALGRDVGLGVPGELWIGGPGVAHGYHRRPALTANVFVPDATAAHPGARCYRTGDLVRWLADGRLDYLGRIDQQVKLRGFRIELGEIEVALARHPKVGETAVLVRHGQDGNPQLIAYATPAEASHRPPPQALRDFLDDTLPDFMVPTAVVVIDSLPLTPAGKVDHKALPIPELDDAPYRAPESEVEQDLARLWCELLQVDRVGLDDDFFRLGGHSLLAVRLMSKIRQRFPVEISVRDLFEHPTLAALATTVAASRPVETDESPAVSEAIALARQRGVLSFSQRRLWFLSRLEPESTAYNMPLAWRLRGNLDPRALERALDDVLRRHDILRSRYVPSTEDGSDEPRMVVEPPTAIKLSAITRTVDSRTALDAALDAEAKTPFDLEEGILRLTFIAPTGDTDLEPVLLWVIHHIAFDGWSVGLLRHELTTLHDAFATDPDSDSTRLLGAPAYPFAEHAARQRVELSDSVLAPRIQAWGQYLDGLQPLELPTDRPRTRSAPATAGSVERTLDPAVVDTTRKLAKQHGHTLFTTLLAVFVGSVQGLTGSRHFAIGIPRAGRDSDDAARSMGFYVDMSVLRFDVVGNPDFSTLARQAHETHGRARACGEVPFDQLVEALQPDRQSGRNPFFEIAFQVLDSTLVGRFTDTSDGSGLRLVDHPVALSQAKFDLVFDIADRGDSLTVIANYNEALFDRSTVERWVDHFERVAAQVTRDPAKPLAELTLLRDEDRALIAKAHIHSSEPAAIFEMSLWDQARRHGASQAEKPAVRYRDTMIPWGRLIDDAERFGRQLVGLGVRPGDFVGLCVHRGPQLVQSLLGIAAAGAAYVPLDPDYPSDRLKFMITDSEMCILVSESAIATTLPSIPGVQVIAVDRLDELPEPESDPVLPTVDADFPAHVIFTSGSTGKPKGTVVAQRGVSILLRDAYQFGDRANDVVAQVVSPSFDASCWELWSSLVHGATLAVIDREELLSPQALARALAHHQVSVGLITTAYFQQIARDAPAAIEGLRLALFGGERCEPDAIRHAVEVARRGGTRLFNCYGPTEATIMATRHEVDHVPEGALSVPIGQPVPQMACHVIDAMGRAVGVGVAGELWLGGPGVAIGYHRRPRLTANAFVPDPFSPHAGARCYRTGDLVRWLDDGSLDFLGRIDHQVKLRGYRIEPGEIATVLARHPYVADTAAMVRYDAGEPRLVAYATGAKDMHRPTPEALIQFLAEELPDYMVPSTVMVLDSLPLTPVGKVDHRALPAPEQAQAAHRPPETALAKLIARIWMEVLEVERVGLDDEFFALGGHSLVAAKIFSRLHSMLHIELPLTLLFDHPVLDELAQAMTAYVLDQPGGGETLELLEELEAMTDEERALLDADL